jgi:hypothetical protein
MDEKNIKTNDKYDDCYQDLEKKRLFLQKLKNNEFPEIELLLELQWKIYKQDNYFYIIPQDTSELVEQLEEYLDTEKRFLDNSILQEKTKKKEN